MKDDFIPLKEYQKELKQRRRRKTTVLNGLRAQGIDAFLYFGELAAVLRTGGRIPADIAAHIRENKKILIAELKSLTGPGEKVSFDKFLEDRQRKRQQP